MEVHKYLSKVVKPVMPEVHQKFAKFYCLLVMLRWFVKVD